MQVKSSARAVLASVAMVALLGSAQSMADCTPVSVKGKIFNNSASLGGSPLIGDDVSTTGVVALNGGSPIGKLKCALVGVVAGPGTLPVDPTLPPIPIPDFTHLISCEDSFYVEGIGTEHSLVTFDTTGYMTDFDYSCNLSFYEEAVLRGGTGKGVFRDATGGVLIVKGTNNFCTGTIDMTFTGNICKE